MCPHPPINTSPGLSSERSLDYLRWHDALSTLHGASRGKKVDTEKEKYKRKKKVIVGEESVGGGRGGVHHVLLTRCWQRWVCVQQGWP